ncbi:MAG: caspase family protein, partial [Candidatus Obscuribacterales bacterium]|nr:caspase family protein [Candidatus Obscuribacterales bacterium]
MKFIDCFCAAFFSATFVIAQSWNSALAQNTDKSTAAKIEFTKIQDLDPNKKALNRPVRQKWGVVIGISKFADRRLNTEQGFSKSARAFYDYLLSPKGGRFRADHLRLLTDEAASAQSINNSFADSWLGKLAEPDDLVVVYIATRAFPTTDGSNYLCSYNCSMDNIYGTCLSIQSLMDSLRKQVKSERIVLILESSGSGAVDLASASKSNLSSLNLDLERVALGKGFIVLSSSKPEQLSWGTLFTDNLINALKEK